MLENLSIIPPQGGELVVPVEGTFEAEIIEEAAEDATVDNTGVEIELFTDTVVENATTADPLDEDKSKKFIVGNFIPEGNTNEILYRFSKMGGSINMTPTGYEIRLSPESQFHEVTKTQAMDMLSNVFKKEIVIGRNAEADIKTYELKMVMGTKFKPNIKSEYFVEDGVVYRNTFRPTVYMELDKSTPFQMPVAILALLLHLTVTKDRLAYFLNWLAYFFQFLKKPPVAMVLKGRQGAGKGIFWDYIAKALFGVKQCFQLNDKTIRGNFLADALDGKLVIGCDEISHGGTDNKLLKNFLKGIISNPTGSHEKKHKSLNSEISLCAAVLITTNEVQSLEVEYSDRRFTIYETGDNLAKVDFLGYGSFHNLLASIENELEAFSLYLLNYDVDVNLACTAQDTPEKQALVGVTNDRFQNFAQAIMKKNLNYFSDLTYEAPALYNDLKVAFIENRISRKKLKETFCAIEEEKISARKLMSRLRAIDSDLFGDSNTKGRSTGDVMYCLNEEIVFDEASAPATPSFTPCSLPGFPQGIVINPSL